MESISAARVQGVPLQDGLMTECRGRHGERVTIKGAGVTLAGLIGDLFICS